jgi:hypothetical protein
MLEAQTDDVSAAFSSTGRMMIRRGAEWLIWIKLFYDKELHFALRYNEQGQVIKMSDCVCFNREASFQFHINPTRCCFALPHVCNVYGFAPRVVSIWKRNQSPFAAQSGLAQMAISS